MAGECERQRVEEYRCDDRWLVNVRDRLEEYRCDDTWLVNVRDREWRNTGVKTDDW